MGQVVRVALWLGLLSLPFFLAGDSHRFRHVQPVHDPGNPLRRAWPPPPDDVSFECELGEDPEGVHIDYTIRNGSTKDLGVFNHPWWRSVVNYDELVAASFIRFDGQALYVDIGAVPLIRACSDCGPQLPGTTVVRPGTTFSERVALPEPVREADFDPEDLFGDGSVVWRPFGYMFGGPYLSRVVEPIVPASTMSIVFTVQVEQVTYSPKLSFRSQGETYYGRKTSSENYVFSRRFELRRPLRVLAYDVAGYEWVSRD